MKNNEEISRPTKYFDGENQLSFLKLFAKIMSVFSLGSCSGIPLPQLFSLDIGFDSKEKPGKEMLL